MKRISILVPNGENNLSSIVGSYKILNRANDFWSEKGKKQPYKIELVGLSKKVNFHGDLFSVKPQSNISEIKKTDLIIIPSLNHNYDESVKKNKAMISWIEEQYRNGAEVASICTGAFLLAESGLLNGKSCSTHWSAAGNLANKFPKINVQTDQLITHEHGIYTNGGAFSFLNLIIYLVEKYFDRPTAIFCSKVFQIDMDRQSQSQFIIFSGQKKHGDDVVIKAQSFIEKNLSDKISMESLSSRLNVSRRNFDRRFIRATGNTPIEYAQRVKMEAVKKYLETTQKNVNEVMYDVGYTDVKAFREVFRKVTGLSPVEYKQRFSKG
jgi:transcriptional regulator GlxA family with amidase domain